MALGMELKPFTLGLYSGEGPARGLIASAILDKALKDRYGGSVPMRSLVLVRRLDVDIDKAMGRVLEALSKAGVDVPPARLADVGSSSDVDAYIAFTRDEMRTVPGDRPAYFLGDLAGTPDREVEDTLGDFTQLALALGDVVGRALPSILLISRYTHMGKIVELMSDIVDHYRAVGDEMSRLSRGFSAPAAALERLEEIVLEMSAPEGPIRRYAEAYGNVCLCGGTMQLVSERYRNGVYELTFACDRCGRRIVRYH